MRIRWESVVAEVRARPGQTIQQVAQAFGVHVECENGTVQGRYERDSGIDQLVAAGKLVLSADGRLYPGSR